MEEKRKMRGDKPLPKKSLIFWLIINAGVHPRDLQSSIFYMFDPGVLKILNKLGKLYFI